MQTDTVRIVQHDLTQQKLEAVMLSNELLSSSLEGARKHIATLESTISSLKEELENQEQLMKSVNGRITTMLRCFEVCGRGEGVSG